MRSRSEKRGALQELEVAEGGNKSGPENEEDYHALQRRGKKSKILRKVRRKRMEKKKNRETMTKFRPPGKQKRDIR